MWSVRLIKQTLAACGCPSSKTIAVSVESITHSTNQHHLNQARFVIGHNIMNRITTNVDQKLLRTTKFPPEFNQKVDTTKINIPVIKK